MQKILWRNNSSAQAPEPNQLSAMRTRPCNVNARKTKSMVNEKGKGRRQGASGRTVPNQGCTAQCQRGALVDWTEFRWLAD
eukprot:6193529-Pleurochrysis_carterae.AAC.2